MSESQPGLILTLSLVGALLLLALELALSVALVAASALSRVALRRLGAESGGRLRFVVSLRTPPSTYRSAAYLARQLSLLGGCVLLGVTAWVADWPYPWILGVIVGAVVGVVFVEGFVARGLALVNPRLALRLTAHVVRLVHAVLYPFVAPLNRVLWRISLRARDREDGNDEDQDEEVEALIEVGESEGILEGEEGRMIRGIADLDETRVREIMTARTDIVSLPVTAPIAEARRTMIESGHSRIPVFRHSIDNVVGILHARDLIRAWEEGKAEARILEYVRPAHFVPETLTLAELLTELRLRTQIAMVIDEYGGIAGLVSLEDLVEEIVGEIRDEHDEEEQRIQEQADGSWIVSGVVPVKELEDLFRIDIGEREFDTVAGLVVAGVGRVPRKGERLQAHGLQFEVLEADPRRVYRVRVGRAAESSGDVQVGG